MLGKKNGTQDAAQLLARLTQHAAVLRGTADLEASHEELQLAARAGTLVCWRPCKLNGEDGQQWFAPGEALPKLDAQHTLLQPDKRLVTTKQRWTAMQEYRRLAGYLQQDARASVQAKHKHATAQVAAAGDEVKRLEIALATAQQALREAQAQKRAADNELRSFVERAPA